MTEFRPYRNPRRFRRAFQILASAVWISIAVKIPVWARDPALAGRLVRAGSIVFVSFLALGLGIVFLFGALDD